MVDIEQVIETYRVLQKIKPTARQLELSEATVRRILVAEGEYTSPRAAEIARMREHGMTVGEIAAELGIGKKAVCSYLPYTKGHYAIGNKSKNALAIARMREKRLDSGIKQ